MGPNFNNRNWEKNFKASQKRLQLKERAVAHMGGCCVLCGYARCVAALEFHHRDPRTKDFAISSRMSWEAIVKELKGCELVCATCHREIHAGMHPRLLDPDDDRRLTVQDWGLDDPELG